MNGDTFEVPMGRKNRSLSFSHSRFHRNTSSSDEDDVSPVRNVCFQNEYDDEGEYSRESISEFSRIRLHDGQKHDLDDLSAITRKRTFSSSEPNSADADSTTNGKSSTTEKRMATKICRVCGDKAYSYNFSQITCESCKGKYIPGHSGADVSTFFRRNANKSKEIRCPFSDQCDINIVSRRFCQKCRLAKCFKVGMKKEWIMSEEARREKKQRIQDNRERRMHERAQEEKLNHHQIVAPVSNQIVDPAPAQIITNGIQMTPPSDPTIVQPVIGSTIGQQSIAPLAPLTSHILPNLPLAPPPDISTIIPPVLPSIVSVPPPVQIVQTNITTQPEPATVMQQVIQQAQQVQNAQILAQVAMQNQPDAIATIQQAAQIASSINTTAVQTPATNPIAAAANLNNLSQIAAMQAPSDTIVSIQQAAQIAQSVQSPTTTASIAAAANLVQAAAQMQQQINANLAAQRIQASQNLADQQQLAAAVAVAAAVSNQPQIISAAGTEPLQPSIASVLPAIIPPNPAPLASIPIAPPIIEPVIQPVLPPATTNPNNEMIAVRKDVLMGIVQENIENRQAQMQQQLNTPPVKCKCVCQCGRYGNDSVIVDKVMADMLHEVKHTNGPVVSHQHESMDCSRADINCCLLSEEDKTALNELEEADRVFWAAQAEITSIDQNAADVALRKLIRMMTSLSSFNKFSRADQSNLLKHGCASHFAIRQVMGGEHSQNLMVTQFFNSLREEWRTNRQLMLLVSILVVFDPDTPNIENKPQIVQTCSRLKSILKRMLYTIYQDPQKTTLEFDDLINKLNVLQSLNNTIPQNQNGVDSHRIWSAEILEPLLSRELFEPSMMITSSTVNTISSMT